MGTAAAHAHRLHRSCGGDPGTLSKLRATLLLSCVITLGAEWNQWMVPDTVELSLISFCVACGVERHQGGPCGRPMGGRGCTMACGHVTAWMSVIAAGRRGAGVPLAVLLSVCCCLVSVVVCRCAKVTSEPWISWIWAVLGVLGLLVAVPRGRVELTTLQGMPQGAPQVGVVASGHPSR